MKTSPIILALALIITIAIPVAVHGKTTAPTFVNVPLIRPDGSSEPEVTVGADGTAVFVGLSWTQFATNTWKATFGQTPAFQGQVDASLAAGVGGGEDADVDLGSTGTLHATTLLAFFNPQTKITQLGVSAITCPNADLSSNFTHCTSQIIDTTQADRPWVTSDGVHVYISYHDSGSSTTIHVQRSDDDGITFHRVGDPIVGQGGATGNSTFDNDQGKIIADKVTQNVYDVYASGVGGLQKAKTANFNNIYVSKSTDMGKTWTPTLVFSGTTNVALNNVFPVLAADPLSGNLYAGWSDAHNVFLSKSTDQGQTWTSPIIVNVAPAVTAVFPWIAARGGTVDYVYYGTSASSKDDPSAVWNVYIARSTDGAVHFAQTVVTSHPNHVGVVCTNGTGCQPGTRNLLDLFQDAINPANGMVAIIYTDDTLTTESNGSPLPQVGVAYQTS
ncbi:hypothetical protein AUI06_09405 [archaeon 13_2_20CM_2_52_21]|nr:MAG: hypothetical protein AUI06_09405 [archaeon 13_2_20CM_2_52_21]OLD44485.1 MAG: hypothetical protein AUI51_01980 [archaeon 13_1_40CM_2_52_4]